MAREYIILGAKEILALSNGKQIDVKGNNCNITILSKDAYKARDGIIEMYNGNAYTLSVMELIVRDKLNELKLDGKTIIYAPGSKVKN